MGQKLSKKLRLILEQVKVGEIFSQSDININGASIRSLSIYGYLEVANYEERPVLKRIQRVYKRIK